MRKRQRPSTQLSPGQGTPGRRGRSSKHSRGSGVRGPLGFIQQEGFLPTLQPTPDTLSQRRPERQVLSPPPPRPRSYLPPGDTPAPRRDYRLLGPRDVPTSRQVGARPLLSSWPVWWPEAGPLASLSLSPCRGVSGTERHPPSHGIGLRAGHSNRKCWTRINRFEKSLPPGATSRVGCPRTPSSRGLHVTPLLTVWGSPLPARAGLRASG